MCAKRITAPRSDEQKRRNKKRGNKMCIAALHNNYLERGQREIIGMVKGTNVQVCHDTMSGDVNGIYNV